VKISWGTVLARFLAIAIAALVLAGCRDLTSSTGVTTPPIVVHAVLDLGSSDQFVLITRARTGGDGTTGTNVGSGAPVNGALITITGPNGVQMFATPDHFRDGTPVPGQYRISLPQFGEVLVPGASYALHILLTTGERVSGSTTVPDVAPIRGDINNLQQFRITRDTIRLSWQRISVARGYEAHVETPQVVYSTFVDTSFMMAGTARTIDDDPLFVLGVPTMVVISAVDQNYYEYYRTPSDPFAGTPPSNLTGAVGFFGSIVPIISQGYLPR